MLLEQAQHPVLSTNVPHLQLLLLATSKSPCPGMQVWIDMLGKAVLYLLAEVHPKSSHKFDDDLMCVITKQLRLWTAGTLPSDLHPSVMAGGRASPVVH